MKKLLVGILVLSMIFCCIGCGEESEAPTNQQDNQNIVDANSTNPSNTSVSNSAVENTAKCVKCGSGCETGHTYCSSHECWESGCLLQQKDMSIYCANHSCLLCGSSRSFNSAYCSSHKCNKCENVVVDGSNYCVAHKCQLCDNQTFGNSPYCATHN